MLSPLFRFAWRVHTEHRDRVPAAGGVILAPNHLSVLDSFFLPLVMDRPMTYVGKAEYMDDWKTRYLFPAIGMIPIDRSGGDASQRALDAAAAVLERGELFGIYPEGTRSRDGRLHKGHTGVARLALRTGAPIVPVGIVGSLEVQAPDARAAKPFREVTIRFGHPIDVRRYADRGSDRLILRQITDEVMYGIRELSGQDYEDAYATRSHETMPTEAAEVRPPRPATASLPDVLDAPVDPSTSAAYPTVGHDVDGIETPAADGVPAETEAKPRMRAEAAAPRSSTAVLQPRPMIDLTL
ncbi:MAG: 1-acyl-sn-glycerol-3-phosphate acyltransferase [Microthrixaceae bacterium]